MLEGLLIGILNLLLGAAGAIGGLALTMFTKFGEKIIGYAFDKRIEKYKSDLERQVEHLRAKLSHLSDRGTRSNEFEYDAITSAWERYIRAHQATLQCVARISEHPDFNLQTAEQLEDYLKTTDFSDGQKKQMREAQNKNDMFSKIERLRAINQAGTAIYEGHQVLANKGIFIPSDLEIQFDSALQFCARAWAVEKTDFSYGNAPGSSQPLIQFLEQERGVRNALKVAVRNRILAAYPAAPAEEREN
jgi:hypothetical protein